MSVIAQFGSVQASYNSKRMKYATPFLVVTFATLAVTAVYVVRVTGMPAFRPNNAGEDEDSWKLVRLIRHHPEMTDEEVARMKDMNPKSPADLQEEDEIQRFLEGESEPSGETQKHHH